MLYLQIQIMYIAKRATSKNVSFNNINLQRADNFQKYLNKHNLDDEFT